MTPYSREEHKLAQQSIDGIEDEIEQARRYLVDGWQSFTGVGNDWGITKSFSRHPETGREREPVNTRATPEGWNTLPQRILAAAPHLQGDPNPIDSRQCLNEVGQAFVEPSIDARVEMARRYLVQGWQSFKKDTTVSSDGWRAFTSAMQSGGNHVDCPGEWHTIPQRILTATEAFKKCYIENDDAVKCIERWATPHTAIYADPPYVNAEGYYQVNAKAGKDANLEMHHRLAATLNTVEASAVIVSYYPNELLDELYPEENWERHYKDTVASSAGITRNSKTRTRPKRTELLLVRKSKGDNPVVNLSGQMSLL
jgi:site-specific DNA-adenine methylase